MSAAVMQGHVAVDYFARDQWDATTPEPQTPLSTAALAAIAQARADVAVALAHRFGPDSDVAQMLGLDSPLVEVLRDVTATSTDVAARFARMAS